MELFVPVKINYYNNSSGFTTVYDDCFKTLEECQDFFDKGDRGVYLRTREWSKHELSGEMFKLYDHDGALVRYICKKVILK